MSDLSGHPSSPLRGTAAQLQRDLEILCDGPEMDLNLRFDGVVMTLRSRDRLVWQNSAEIRWMRMEGPARVRILAAWIHAAAQKYASLLGKRIDVA